MNGNMMSVGVRRSMAKTVAIIAMHSASSRRGDEGGAVGRSSWMLDPRAAFPAAPYQACHNVLDIMNLLKVTVGCRHDRPKLHRDPTDSSSGGATTRHDGASGRGRQLTLGNGGSPPGAHSHTRRRRE